MVKFIAGLWVEGQPAGNLTTTTGKPVMGHVSIHSVAQKEAFSAMSPDDADALAHELRNAAAVARGEETIS